MNEGIVRERKPLSTLLCEENPFSVAGNGEPFRFDPVVIPRLGQELPDDLHRRLRLPVLFYGSPDTPDSCSCPDPVALDAFRMPGEVSTFRTLQQGKFWVSRPLVYAMVQKYPTAVPIVIGG